MVAIVVLVGREQWLTFRLDQWAVELAGLDEQTRWVDQINPAMRSERKGNSKSERGTWSGARLLFEWAEEKSWLFASTPCGANWAEHVFTWSDFAHFFVHDFLRLTITIHVQLSCEFRSPTLYTFICAILTCTPPNGLLFRGLGICKLSFVYQRPGPFLLAAFFIWAGTQQEWLHLTTNNRANENMSMIIRKNYSFCMATTIISSKAYT